MCLTIWLPASFLLVRDDTFLRHTLGWYWKGGCWDGCGLGRLWVCLAGGLLYPAQDCPPPQPVGDAVRAGRKRREGGQTWPSHHHFFFSILSCSHHPPTQPCSQTLFTLFTLNMLLRLVSMASSMVLSFLGSVEVVVKEGDWEELSVKASTRSPHRDPSHDLGHIMITQTMISQCFVETVPVLRELSKQACTDTHTCITGVVSLVWHHCSSDTTTDPTSVISLKHCGSIVSLKLCALLYYNT